MASVGTSARGVRQDRSAGARPELAPTAAPLPAAYEPMLCTLVAEPFDHPDWVFEPKLDGLRVLGRFDGRKLDLISRNGKSQNFQFPDVAEALRAALDRPAVVDGEIVCLDERGRSSFRALQQRFHLLDAGEVSRRSAEHPAYLYLFDLLYWDEYDVTSLPLRRRKELLRQAVRWSDRIRPTEAEPGSGVRLLDGACRGGEEGIVAKHLDGRYTPGRSPEWVKIKCVGRQEFVVGGWTDPQRSRVGLGALLVGYYEEGAGGKPGAGRGPGRFVYAGKVGTGYTRQTLLDLRRRLDAIGRRSCPFDAGDPPEGEGVHWVKPELVAEIGYAEWTQNGLLRQPRFEGLRMDKKPQAVRREKPKSTPAAVEQADRETREGGKRSSHHLREPSGSAAGPLGRETRPAKPNSPNVSPRTSGASTESPDELLAEYERKRDFRKTAEPDAHDGKADKPHARPIFVIQEHHASKLHYDFRLESDGVLKSWAVPKQPTMDPAVKRLAVHVEDHPLAYANFTGDIAEGQYGAGHVDIWDRGTYENTNPRSRSSGSITGDMAAGKVEFELHGEKLKGGFVLVRAFGRGGKENWLLMKRKDRFARAGDDGAERDGDAGAGEKADSNGKASTATAQKAHAARRRAQLRPLPPTREKWSPRANPSGSSSPTPTR